MNTLYSIKNTKTGLYWNGQAIGFKMTNSPRRWKKKSGAEDALGYYYRYQSRYGNKLAVDLADLVIEEVELVEKVKGSESLEPLIRHIRIRQELNKVSTTFSSFYHRMKEKNVEDTLVYLVDLEPSAGKYYVDRDRIIEARAQVRGLGIKTRTFREYNGVFGFVNKDQAMKARLVLNVKDTVDLEKIRNKVDQDIANKS